MKATLPLCLLLATALLAPAAEELSSRAASFSSSPAPSSSSASAAPVPAASSFGSGSSAFGTVAQTTSMEVLNDSTKLGLGDRVSYRVVEEKRDPLQLIVTDSGEMEVPLIGRVVAKGKSCKQLAREIKPLLEKQYFYHATVIIGLDVLSTRTRGKVYLTGQVHNQGGLELMPDEPMTVSKAVLHAGGLADFADDKHVKLIRKQPDGKTTTTIVNLARVLGRGEIDKDAAVEPGDLIVVPARTWNF